MSLVRDPFMKIVEALDKISDESGVIQADPHTAACEVAGALGIPLQHSGDVVILVGTEDRG